MFRVYTCLTADHDWHLVVLAVAVCLLASAVAVSLFHRALATTGRTRLIWLSLDAAAGGCGIWATHFIAMLAYDPGIGAGYSIVLTVLSLLIAVSITAAGLGVALLNFGSWTSLLGGAAVGGGIAAMHYTGMMALELPGRITWAPGLVLVSVTFGFVFGALAVFFAARRDDWVNTATAVILLTLAIVSMHFTGMGAVLVHAGSHAFRRCVVIDARVSFSGHRQCDGGHSRNIPRRGIERPTIATEAAAAEGFARYGS